MKSKRRGILVKYEKNYRTVYVQTHYRPYARTIKVIYIGVSFLNTHTHIYIRLLAVDETREILTEKTKIRNNMYIPRNLFG